MVTQGKILSITLSVPCPIPVLASEPNNRTAKEVAVGFSDLNKRQARSGPIVWEEEGPFPILYNSFKECISYFTPDFQKSFMLL
jgi:hypothetical protein